MTPAVGTLAPPGTIIRNVIEADVPDDPAAVDGRERAIDLDDGKEGLDLVVLGGRAERGLCSPDPIGPFLAP